MLCIATNTLKRRMVAVHSKICARASFIKPPVWGVIPRRSASVYVSRKSGLPAGLVTAFKPIARCNVASSNDRFSWGLVGEQPNPCPEHGIPEDVLVNTVREGRNMKSPVARRTDTNST